MAGRYDPAGKERGELMQGERVLTRLTQVVGIAEIMGAPMVAATVFSAIATWRTATVTRDLYLLSERPYFGVQSITIDHSSARDPKILISYANLGTLSALDVIVTRELFVGGRRLDAQSAILTAGILSPKVTHVWHTHFPVDADEAIRMGRSQLVVEIKAVYSGPAGGRDCYLEHFAYDKEVDNFDPSGGTTRCDDQDE
jgi:hypothetical protein